MSRVNYEFFGDEFDLVEFTADGSGELTVTLGDLCGRDVFGNAAYLELSGVMKKCEMASASFDISHIENSESLTPTLLWGRKRYTLPPLSIKNGRPDIPNRTADYARLTAKHLEHLEAEIERHGEKIERLERLVFGSSVL